MALPVNDDSLLQRLRLYNPPSGYEQVSLQLFGMPGHGKSSIINTCVQIVHRGDFKNVAGSGKSNYPITTERTDYALTSNVVITDNRGVNKMSPEEQEEVAAQMGQMRGRNRVEWDRSLRGKLNLIHQHFNERPIEVTVPVFVYSVESLLSDVRYEEIEPFIREAHKITGIYPIVVLTKVGTHRDMADECYDKFRALGANHIFRIENYTVEQHEHNPNTQTEILKFLDTCLKEVDDSIAWRASEDPQKKYMDHAMDAVHNIIQKETEKNAIKIQKIKEKSEEEKEQLRKQCEEKNAIEIQMIKEKYEKSEEEKERLRKLCEEKEQKLERLRRRSRCTVM